MSEHTIASAVHCCLVVLLHVKEINRVSGDGQCILTYQNNLKASARSTSLSPRRFMKHPDLFCGFAKCLK